MISSKQRVFTFERFSHALYIRNIFFVTFIMFVKFQLQHAQRCAHNKYKRTHAHARARARVSYILRSDSFGMPA